MAIKVYDTTGQAVSNTDGAISYSGSYAFSFTSSIAGNLGQVQLGLSDAAASTDGGSLTVALYSSTGSGGAVQPGTLIASLGTISDASLSSTPGLVTLGVPAGIALVAGTRYWIQVTGSSTSHARISYEAAGAGTGTSGEYFYEGSTSPDTSGATIASVSVDVPTKVYDTTGQAVSNTDGAISYSGSYAFSFTSSIAGNLGQVQLGLSDAAASTDGGSLTVALYSSTGSGGAVQPGTLIASLGTISDASLSSTPGLVTLGVPAGIGLVAGTRYWIQVTGSSTSHARISYEAGAAGTGTSGEYFYEGSTSPDASGATIASVAVTPACYCPGTLILTECGEVPVQDLAEGDRVVTVSGAVKPIRWIGRRSYAGRFLVGQAHLYPIRIRAGALGDGVPRRDLLVSPKHAMFLDGMLIPAECLVNGVTVVQEVGLARVDYLHVELDEHDVIWAEGAASETYADDDNRNIFHNAGEYWARCGETTAGPARYCAPRVEDGYALDAVRRAVTARMSLLPDAGEPARLAG